MNIRECLVYRYEITHKSRPHRQCEREKLSPSQTRGQVSYVILFISPIYTSITNVSPRRHTHHYILPYINETRTQCEEVIP